MLGKSETYFPKWWSNGDLPWYKVKNNLKQIQEYHTAYIHHTKGICCHLLPTQLLPSFPNSWQNNRKIVQKDLDIRSWDQGNCLNKCLFWADIIMEGLIYISLESTPLGVFEGYNHKLTPTRAATYEWQKLPTKTVGWNLKPPPKCKRKINETIIFPNLYLQLYPIKLRWYMLI